MLGIFKKYYPFLILFFITLVLFNKALIPDTSQILSSGDIKHIHFPYREFLRSSLFSGQIPFWNPYLFSGIPFLAHPYTASFYPTTLLLLFLPSNIYFSFITFAHVLLAGCSMYILLKKYTGVTPSFFGALAYAYGSFFPARIYAGHIDYITSTALIPLIFYFATDYITEGKKRSLFWASLTLGFQIFTGLLNLLFYTLIIVSVFNILTAKFRYQIIQRIIVRTCIFVILTFGLSSIFLLPSFQFISRTIRGYSLPYNIASYGSSTFETLKLFINPYYLGNDLLYKNPYRGPSPNLHEYLYFIGFTSILVILGGLIIQIIKKRFDKKIIVLLIITLLAIIVSLGPNSPINLHLLLWKILPIYKTIRFPVRHLIIAVFALSLAAGLSLEKIRMGKVKLLITLILIWELFTYNMSFIGLSEMKIDLPAISQTFQKILSENEFVRILPDFTLNSPLKEDISFASPLLYRYFSTSGYTPAILSSYYNFIDRVNGNRATSLNLFNSEIVPSFPNIPAISFLNTKYIIVDTSADLLYDKKNVYPILEETSKYRIYRNPNFLPRFFFVTSAKIFDNEKEMADNLEKEQSNLSKVILMTSDTTRLIKFRPNCTDKTDAKIDILKYELNSVSLRVVAPCNGFISSSETNFPGWSAKLDGKNIPVFTGNYSFRAINIPSGNHEIIFYYQPLIYIFSLIISLIFFAVLLYYTSRA